MPTVVSVPPPRARRSLAVLDNYVLIGLVFVVALALPVLAIDFGSLLGPRKPNKIKNDIYECGMETFGPTWVKFKVQYYIFALIFLVFDVEMVLLFPFATAFDFLPIYAIVEAILFILILTAALLYAWRKNALEWS
jgi:NADH:ubiquinone oxidoreductase subunit 3 (subunit A)